MPSDHLHDTISKAVFCELAFALELIVTLGAGSGFICPLKILILKAAAAANRLDIAGASFFSVAHVHVGQVHSKNVI